MKSKLKKQFQNYWYKESDSVQIPALQNNLISNVKREKYTISKLSVELFFRVKYVAI